MCVKILSGGIHDKQESKHFFFVNKKEAKKTLLFFV